ncbi:MAG: TRAP transporter small permease [Tahibacter sp.]
MRVRLGRLLEILHRGEDWLLTILVLALVLLAGAQILLRNVFDSGLTWAEPLLRTLVLWSAMLGAMLATREDQHIALDFIARFAQGTALRVARFLAFGFAAAFCAAMTWHTLGLVALDREGATPGVISLPAWWLECILPFGFAVMALRFALRAVLPPVPADSIAEAVVEPKA